MFSDSLLKQKITFFLLTFFILICCVLTKAQDTITVSDKRIIGGKLKWSDYTGQVDKSSNYWANTLWNVHYKDTIIQTHGDTVKLDLQVWTALQENSWVLPEKESKELQHHEQGHFDFGRLLALEFEKQADSTVLHINNCRHKLDSIFNSILNNVRQMNVQYDKDTNHMWNRKEQKRWNKKIADMLKAAGNFGNDKNFTDSNTSIFQKRNMDLSLKEL